ncbi:MULTISPECIES: FAD-dependent oxidoreductase [Paenibacillus]|uniref:FAD-dependent oxidoreductase n=1 Tax=Paenibacillus TaxID=44249 RepID=UPI0003659BD2|nr:MULTISPECIES: FAD-dependent oxidoreductase [Paenibacillus]
MKDDTNKDITRKAAETELPDQSHSFWRATTELPSFPPLREELDVEIAVVGAGITGITAAYLLAKEGKQVALFDAGKVLDGTTGYTTAKVTSQHGLIYDHLRKHTDDQSAILYYEAAEEAKRFMQKLVEDNQIDCDWQEETAYVYVESDDDEFKNLEKEMEAYRELGIPGEWVESLPIPLRVKGAIALPGQARFHPVQYLKFLLMEFRVMGGQVYENTMIEEVEDGDRPRLLIQDQEFGVTCDKVVSGSHYPVTDQNGFYFARLQPERSYTLAIRAETPFEGGMYLSADEPKHSLRSATFDGQQYVIVGGKGHRTGQEEETTMHYADLETFSGMLLGIKDIPYRWSAQDLYSLDRMPCIGYVTSDKPNILVGTAYAKWGMTSGTLAAIMMTDMIMGRENRYTDLFSPSRKMPLLERIKTAVSHNATVAKELVTGKLDFNRRKADDLEPDQGAVIWHHGKRTGAYRDPEGKLHVVDTTCTHMGCEVGWNEAERSWDCPCHGGRFSYTGEVLEGPPTEPLKQIKS